MQIGIIEQMGRNGEMWPAAWRLNYRDHQLMLGLVERGYVRVASDPTYGERWVLTDAGRESFSSRPVPTTPKVDRRKGWRT